MFTKKEIESLNNLHRYFPGFKELSKFGNNIDQIQSLVTSTEFSLDVQSPPEGIFFEEAFFIKNIEIIVIEKFEDYNSYLELYDNTNIVLDKMKSDLYYEGRYIFNLNSNVLKLQYNLNKGNSVAGRISINIS